MRDTPITDYLLIALALLIVIILIITFTSCDDTQAAQIEYSECYAGDMECVNNIAYMCNYDNWFETWQNCTSINKICYYNEPEHSGGYTGLASCD